MKNTVRKYEILLSRLFLQKFRETNFKSCWKLISRNIFHTALCGKMKYFRQINYSVISVVKA